MEYIVFDLEATCIDRKQFPEKAKKFRNEIIEIGAVKVNERGEVIDTFNRFVKPTLNPILTDFCKELTKIPQERINEAEDFSSVLEMFRTWIGEDYMLCSWGFYDKKQLKKDCGLYHIPDEWLNPHISLRHQYQKIRKLKHRIGTQPALRKEGFTFEGTPHRGIDDALNITKIFVKYLDTWNFGKEE